MDRGEIINELKERVKVVYGKGIDTSYDFDDLRDAIFVKCRKNIGETTLKRIWGYVPSSHTPTKKTLDVLANYCGYDSFDTFGRETVARNEKRVKLSQMTEEQRRQYIMLDKLFENASHSIRFKSHPKYCGKVDVIKEGIKIYSTNQVRTPFIRYRDVLDYKYIVRTMTNYDFKDNPDSFYYYDCEDPVIIQYESLADLVLDGWEPD